MKNRSRFIRYSGVLTVALLLMVIVMSLFPVTTLADSVDLYWIGGTGNWSDTAHWATAADGTGAGHTAPTATNNVYFGALSFNGTGQTVTVDATAYCLDMDWTGVTNNPTLFADSATAARIEVSGNITLGTMTVSKPYISNYMFSLKGNSTLNFTGATVTASIINTGAITINLASAITNNGIISVWDGATLTTNNYDITCTTLQTGSASNATLALGTSTVNCTAFAANTGDTISGNHTINVTGTGVFAGGNITTYNNINLNGTSHTVSGAFTCATLTRNGTATKTDSITFTSGTTVTCTTAAMIGNSATNRLLVQSSTLGTAATITATNWTGTANVDIMDITATNAVDLSAITGLSGDCGGNTNITFTAGAAQTSSKASTWSDATMWTSRVPLPQDDVTCSHTVTVDMPRIGKSITFTGTPTVTLSVEPSNYGSLALVSGMTYTHNNNANYLRGRSSYTLTSNGITMRAIVMSAPTGTITLQDNLTLVGAVYPMAGTLDFNDKNILTVAISDSGAVATRAIVAGNGTITCTDTSGGAKWVFTGTFTAEGSTIVFTNSTANAQTFAGGGLTYNNVTVQGAGNYNLTVSGNNIFNVFKVDASAAAKTITATSTNQTVAQFQRDSAIGTNIVTIAGGTWTKTNSTPNTLNYMTISNSTASPTDTWYAGNNSTDGTGNTGWVFTQATIPSVTTGAATGVSMNAAGTTSATIPFTIGAIDGTPTIYTWVEYGLTNAYGLVTTNATVYSTGSKTAALSTNLTPGATYHFRGVAQNSAGTVYGDDATFTFTLPTIATGTSALGTRWNSVTLNGTVSNMGVASTTGVVFDYGYTPSFGSSTTPQTISGTGSVTTTITGLTGNSTLYYRIRSTNGAVSVNGSVDSYNVPAHSDIFTGLTPVILISPTLLVIGFIFGGFFMIVAGARRGEASGIIIMGIGVLLIGVSAAFIPMIISAFSAILSG